MPIGCIAPIFHIHHLSHFFLCSGLGVLYFRVHHSNIENLRSLTECPLSVKCLDTGVILLSLGFFTERMCSYILDLNARPVSPTYYLLHFLHVIRYTMSLSSQLIKFGNLLSLCTLLDTLHFTVVSLWIIGQYVHLPSQVQCFAMGCLIGASSAGYVMEALVRMSLRFGNLLKPTIGLSLNV